MDSIENVRRIVVRAFELEYPDIPVADINTAISTSGTVAYVEHDEEIGLSALQTLEFDAVYVDMTFAVSLRMAGEIDYAAFERLIMWMNNQGFGDAVSAIQTEDAGFIRPDFLAAQVSGDVEWSDEGHGAVVGRTMMTVPRVRLGVVNGSAPPADVRTTRIVFSGTGVAQSIDRP